MGITTGVCPYIRSMSGCVLKVVSEVVRKLHICHEGEGCNFLGVIAYVSFDVIGIVASSVRGASEACVGCHCS